MPDSVPLEGEPLVAPVADGDARGFDVFLSHNSVDKLLVERIAERLKRARLEPWFDAWDLVPGTDWQRGLADGLVASRSCAVFVGSGDLGAWANEEVAVALDRAATDADFRVFLVLLPGLPERFDAARLRPFLRMRTWVDYRGGLDDERAFQALVSAIKGLPLGPAVPIEPDSDVSPYRGLEVFEEEHAEFFFGREADVQRLLEKLTATRFLGVLGASGSGKSSLVRAGLVPALRRGPLSVDKRWEVLIMRPGAHPLEALAVQLLHLTPGRGMQQTLDALASDPRTLHLAGSLALAQRPQGTRLLLVVDQFEEVFTLCGDERERSAFLANLLYAATIPDGGSGVLLAIRADFYHRCGAFPELAQQLAAEQYLVSPLQPDGLRQAVEEPARRVGLAFEPGLVATILEDVAGQPGALPLLEHALLELWRRRMGGTLTLAGYRDSGGVQGAIAKRAEQVFESLEPHQQELARRTFLRLTQPGEGTEDTRRRADMAELGGGHADGDVGSVLTQLVDARLVTTSRHETAGGGVVEVAHEALIRGWPRLRAWIDEDRAGLRVQLRLTEAAREWQRLGRDDSALYRGARLAEAVEWRAANDESLNELEREFVAAGRTAEQDELEQARRRTRRLRALAAGLAILLVSATGAALLAKRQTDEANAQKREANAQRDRANAEASVASSRALASAAMSYAEDSPALAMLLSLEAYRLVEHRPLGERFEARNSMLTTLQRNARLTRILDADATTVAISRAGDRLASFVRSGKAVHLWDIGGGAPRERRLDHGAGVLAAAFSADGQTLATAGTKGRIRFWDVAAGDPSGALDLDLAAISTLAFSPDGRTLAAGDDGGTVWLGSVVRRSESRGRRLEHSRCYPVLSIAFSADGRSVATGGYHGSIRLWRVPSGDPIGKPLETDPACPKPDESILPVSEVSTLVFGRDGRKLTVADAVAGEVKVFDLLSSAPAGDSFDFSSEFGVDFFDIATVAISPDGATLAAAQTGASGDAEIRFWDLATRTPLSLVLHHGDRVSSLAFSASGDALASTSENGKTRVWNASGRVPLGEPVEGQRDPVASVAFSADGATLAAVGDTTGRAESRTSLTLWDLTRRTTLAKPLDNLEFLPDGVAFNPQGDVLALARDEEKLVLWDVARRARVGRPIDAGDDLTSAAAVSPDGGTLATGRVDGKVQLWDIGRHAARGKPVEADPHPITFLAFSPDGAKLAAESRWSVERLNVSKSRSEIRLWDVTRHGLVARRRVHLGDDVSSFAFDADWSTIATGGSGMIELRDVASGDSLGKLVEGQRDPVVSVAFSPDGATLASAGDNGRVQLWDSARNALLGAPLKAHSHFEAPPTVAFNPHDGSLVSAGEEESLRLWDPTLVSTHLAVWRDRLCAIAGRNLNRDEWRRLIPDRPYPATSSAKTCPRFR